MVDWLFACLFPKKWALSSGTVQWLSRRTKYNTVAHSIGYLPPKAFDTTGAAAARKHLSNIVLVLIVFYPCYICLHSSLCTVCAALATSWTPICGPGQSRKAQRAEDTTPPDTIVLARSCQNMSKLSVNQPGAFNLFKNLNGLGWCRRCCCAWVSPYPGALLKPSCGTCEAPAPLVSACSSWKSSDKLGSWRG